jgi:nitroreductase
MTGTSFISESVRHAVELAGCAPSIHNSQPWVFVLSEQRIDLYADRRRWLPATDADERDLMLSCGAALHHLRVGLADAEIGASVHRMPDAARSDLVASVVLGEDGTDRVDATLSAQIPLRRSDRRPFRPWPMPDAFKRQLIERAAEQGAFLRVIDDADARAILITAFGAAAAEQSGMPGYAEELEAWTDRPGAEGIPGSNVERPVPPTIEAARDFGGQRVVSYNVEPEEATLVVIGASSDDRLSQLRAGEAMSAVLLEATRQGLGNCPLSQPLEVGSTREMLQDEVLGGTLSPQVILRIGWAQEDRLPATPRRSVEEIIGEPPPAG